jgi:hypothetical protein
MGSALPAFSPFCTPSSPYLPCFPLYSCPQRVTLTFGTRASGPHLIVQRLRLQKQSRVSFCRSECWLDQDGTRSNTKMCPHICRHMSAQWQQLKTVWSCHHAARSAHYGRYPAEEPDYRRIRATMSRMVKNWDCWMLHFRCDYSLALERKGRMAPDPRLSPSTAFPVFPAI